MVSAYWKYARRRSCASESRNLAGQIEAVDEIFIDRNINYTRDCFVPSVRRNVLPPFLVSRRTLLVHRSARIVDSIREGRLEEAEGDVRRARFVAGATGREKSISRRKPRLTARCRPKWQPGWSEIEA